MLKRISCTLGLLGRSHRCVGAMLQTVSPTQCHHYYSLSRISYTNVQTPEENLTVATPSPSSLFQSEESANNIDETNKTALDVAIYVNSMKKQHQNGGAGIDKKQIELDAWTALNALTEHQVNTAEGKAVALLLNTWSYFAKYWENGKDGPVKA
ncbi:unnamed protein product [Phytomonas sp. Hart1]|nr:unnamed protein product [Phytomonas sp. Hart1]|eukprot:CCW68650.1 unnamed protein product [Phytomonas sp. isolate Hart1]